MKTLFTAAAVLTAGSALAAEFTITNGWSGASGDKANLSAFAFQANAGIYPASVTPPDALTSTFELGSLTLTRPTDTTTPNIGTANGYLSSVDSPVFVDINIGAYSGGAFSGYVGSSSSSVLWSDTVSGGDYTFNFTGITLNSATKYWFVFSEDNVEGEISNFRMWVNTSGNNTTAGQGQGYLINDTAQALVPALTTRDWGVSYVIAVPEPSVFALAGLGLLLLRLHARTW